MAKPLGRANAIALQMASCRHRSDLDTVTLGLYLHSNEKDEEWSLGIGEKWMTWQKKPLIRPQTLLIAAMNIFTSNDNTER